MCSHIAYGCSVISDVKLVGPTLASILNLQISPVLFSPADDFQSKSCAKHSQMHKKNLYFLVSQCPHVSVSLKEIKHISHLPPSHLCSYSSCTGPQSNAGHMQAEENVE